MDSRGTPDPSERRKLRPREDTDRVGRFLEDLIASVGEHGVLAAPTLAWTLSAVPVDAGGRMLGAYLGLVVSLAVVRRDRLRGRWSGFPLWPDVRLSLLAVRAAYYNAATAGLALLVRLGPLAGADGSSAATALAIVAGGLAGIGLPVVADAVRRALGGGPRARRRDWNALRMDRERNRRRRD